MVTANRDGPSPTPILFTHYGEEWIRGSERCLLDLLLFLDQKKFTPIVWCNSKIMSHAVADMGITVYQTDFPLLFGWLTPRFDIKAYLKLIKQGINIVTKHDIKLLHANSGGPCQFLNWVARWCSVPLLAHLHCRYPVRDRVTLGLHHVSYSIGVSQPVIEQLINDGISKEKTLVIQNGINTGHLLKQQPVDIREILNFNDRDFVLISVGSLIHRKGLDRLIDSISRLVKQDIPVRLVIVGSGSEEQQLYSLVRQFNLQQHVFFLGERNDVAGLLKGGVDLFVSAAREEVFGLVLAEAGLAGLAVVAPNIGGIPFVVEDNKTGLLYTPESSNELDNAISIFYHSQQLRDDMGAAGKLRVLKHFDIQQNVNKFEHLYLRLINNVAQPIPWNIGPVIRSASNTIFRNFCNKAGLHHD